ncbi:MAG: Holliday junction branch migration protein RuvA [Chloroflexi bacterium]|nr:Holliday junction branch migration protein RuvA [Chloroflexota bacterium]
MIVNVRGTLEGRGADSVRVTIGGVTLQVRVSTSTSSALGPVGSTVSLLTHLLFRDDAITLIGFATAEEKTAFLALQNVSGIGPRLALEVLSVLTPARLAEAIESGEADTIVQVPGIGKRTAARMIVELKGKLDEVAYEVGGAPGANPASDPDLAGALQALGYTSGEIRRAAGALSDATRNMPLEDRIRGALQALATS